MQESQQGQELIKEHGPDQRPATLSGLVDSFDHDVDAKILGRSIINGLDDFDVITPPYGDFDFSARNKFIKNIMNARGIAEWERNQRVVDVEFDIAKDEYLVRPFDNNNINSWIGPQGMPEILIKGPVNAIILGQAVLKAFGMATYHPDRMRTL